MDLALAMRILPFMAAAVLAGPCDAASPDGIDALRWRNRVVVIAAPAADDPRLVEQQRALAAWRQGAEERDVAAVRVVGAGVEGVGDTADHLRGRFALPRDRFTVLLLGRDGQVALRSAAPVSGAELTRIIDAMPMRRAGQR